jgi:hypothetical protein
MSTWANKNIYEACDMKYFDFPVYHIRFTCLSFSYHELFKYLY